MRWGLVAVICSVGRAFLFKQTQLRAPTKQRGAFHSEGDLSGDYRLSGVWRLERDPVDDAPVRRPVPIQASWSEAAQKFETLDARAPGCGRAGRARPTPPRGARGC